MPSIEFTTTHGQIKPSGFYVYVHQRASDGSVFYVGKGKGKRAWLHSRNDHWKRVAAKHGVIVRILKDNMSHQCALTLERIVISAYGLENLCNYTGGGQGLHGFSHTDETKKKISSAQLGELNHMYGKEIPESVKAKLRESCKGWKKSTEAIEKTARAHRGMKRAEETCKKIGLSKSKPVETVCGLKFLSSMDAVRWLRANGHPNASHSHIGKCCRGVASHKSYLGYKWKFSVD